MHEGVLDREAERGREREREQGWGEWDEESWNTKALISILLTDTRLIMMGR